MARTPRGAVAVAAALVAAVGLYLAMFPPRTYVVRFMLEQQDLWLLIGAGLIGIAACLRLRPRDMPLQLSRIGLAMLALLLIAFTFAGHWWVLSGHDLSRDEQMASFDTAVFAKGQLVAPLAGIWRGHPDPLNTLFMLDAPGQHSWISAYLPMNAAIRAATATLLGTPWLAGPLLAALGLVAIWGCARRLWPDSREAPAIAALLYALSGQVLFTAMTSYAMTAHLVLNLVWLWLFLARKWRSDLACLAVGFIATGLHQPLFHPMFAAPILLLLVIERDWKRTALFLAGYAAIGLFWYAWPEYLATLLGSNGAASADGTGTTYLERLETAIGKDKSDRFGMMAANLLRFVAWMPVLLLPLLLLGIGAARRNRIAAALLGGIVLTVVTMLILLPFQGHGFGYRYLHGLIGNALLLCVFGLSSLRERRDEWRTLLVRTAVAGPLLLLPLQLWLAYAMYAAPAGVERAIDRIEADYVLIGAVDAPFSANLALNPPALKRRPVRLIIQALDPAEIARLCASAPSVQIADKELFAPLFDYYRIPAKSFPARDQQLTQRLSAAGCRVAGQE